MHFLTTIDHIDKNLANIYWRRVINKFAVKTVFSCKTLQMQSMLKHTHAHSATEKL